MFNTAVKRLWLSGTGTWDWDSGTWDAQHDLETKRVMMHLMQSVLV